jgi:RNA polymerase sigma-70 factor (ECF subfamily)
MLIAASDVLGGDRGLAEDAVQVAFVKAWQASARFDPGRDLAPWLYAIVRRCAIDLVRHERRRRARAVEDVEEALLPGPADGFEQAWEAAIVQDAIDALPAEESEVVRLVYYAGFTHREIAEYLEIPIGTVKSRTARAHARLRSRIGSHLDGSV